MTGHCLWAPVGSAASYIVLIPMSARLSSSLVRSIKVVAINTVTAPLFQQDRPQPVHYVRAMESGPPFHAIRQSILICGDATRAMALLPSQSVQSEGFLIENQDSTVVLVGVNMTSWFIVAVFALLFLSVPDVGSEHPSLRSECRGLLPSYFNGSCSGGQALLEDIKPLRPYYKEGGTRKRGDYEYIYSPTITVQVTQQQMRDPKAVAREPLNKPESSAIRLLLPPSLLDFPKALRVSRGLVQKFPSLALLGA